MAKASRDLFDDGTMSFGDHLEALRTHLWKAILGLGLCVVGALFFGEELVGVIRGPIDDALKQYGHEVAVTDDIKTEKEMDWWQWLKEQFGFSERPPEAAPPAPENLDRISVEVNAFDLASELHRVAPETYAEPPESVREATLSLPLRAPEFALWRGTTEEMHRPVTLNVQEAFMTFLKVSMIAGVVIASPWVFYQIWMFVAEGLYKHERKHVYLYGLMSLGLFLTGTAFCFYVVFPFVLKWLLAFNVSMGLTPQIRLSEWVSFAVVLPLMFGISFQLPLVMRFLQALSIFDERAYREKRRMSILVIAALSMFLTPADPMSMLLMMFPLIFLYELGIWLCHFAPPANPFEAGPV
jgi:sec-independent protein translocase protein TatC